MDRVKEPDLVVDRCPECGGTFFDKGELDVLVTGLSGWHLHLFSEPERQDVHSAITCAKPSCGGETMLKKTISDLSEIIFDYCPKCEGVFLDKGEIQEVSQELEPAPGANPNKKTREYIDDHLVVEETVSVDYVVGGCGAGGGGGFVGICYFVRSSIYFEESLGLGLKMFSEKWTDKLFKGIGLSRKQDIQVGDDQIDSRFIIQGTDEKEIISLLSDQNIRKNINLLDEKRLKKGAIKGSFKIFDNRVTYSEGPYDHVVGYADIADPEGVREAMINLVKSVEDCYE